MYIERKVDVELLAWRKLSSRKPLLIRGARQVGKSTAVRNLSKQFDHFIEINFDEQPEYQNLFANTSDIIVTYFNNRRYTMKDIGALDTRISNLEYYTSLSLLEQDAINLQDATT